MKLTIALMMLPGLVIGLTVHEFAHAWSASLLGDGFARRQGRVSLNPFRHLSPLGTLAIFFLPFGWGKPVPVNLYNFKHPRRDYLLTSLAGPLANLVVVGLGLALMRLTRHSFRLDGWAAEAAVWAHFLLALTVIINVMLAALNLIPIPPLDGSKIWPCIVPNMKLVQHRQTTGISLVILLVLISTDAIRPVTEFALQSVMRLMPVSEKEAFHRSYSAAASAFDAKQWPQAEAHFTQALQVNPESDDCFYGRAVARFAQRNWQGALDDMNEAIRLRPMWGYYALRAQLFRALGRTAEAKADDATARSLHDAASRPEAKEE